MAPGAEPLSTETSGALPEETGGNAAAAVTAAATESNAEDKDPAAETRTFAGDEISVGA